MPILGVIFVWIGVIFIIFYTGLLPFIGLIATIGCGLWATGKVLAGENVVTIERTESTEVKTIDLKAEK